MSTSQEAPALIQYACERCKTRFVLPPSSRRLSIGGKMRAFSSGLGRTFRFHEGLGAGYDSARRQLLAKMDDEAYQSFVQSFRFCHECRQFVCNECWSTSRRSCLTCVAKSMTGAVRPRPPFAPAGPEIPRPVVAAGPGGSRRLRRDLALVALALGLVMVALEVGALVANNQNGAIAVATPTATPTQTAVPTASPTPTATLVPTLTPTPTPTPVPTPAPTEVATPTPTPTPSPSPSPSPSPAPKTTPKSSSTPSTTTPKSSSTPSTPGTSSARGLSTSKTSCSTRVTRRGGSAPSFTTIAISRSTATSRRSPQTLPRTAGCR